MPGRLAPCFFVMENHYHVLGLKRGASLKEISAAYRSQALIYHPDKRKNNHQNVENDEKFFKIKAAYQALQDPKIRAELDLQLIGQEERIKRDAQMSVQRKRMRDDLLDREREAAAQNGKVQEYFTQPSQETKKKTENSDFLKYVTNPNSCLLLKCKFPANIKREFAIEMIKSSLNPIKLHSDPNSETLFALEFRDSQDAYRELCKLPNDFIVKADWLNGYPPSGLKINLTTSQTSSSTTSTVNSNIKEEKTKFSKEFEESVLERLKRKKLEKQQQ